MRDRDAYAREGRNDPRSPDQMREHPYDFVSLPEKLKKVEAPGHDSYPSHLYSGVLTLVYQTLVPLHIGSGSFDSSTECGFSGADQPLRGIVRRAGMPILPGSSWKGAVRARFEAITRSRIALAQSSYKLDDWKVPQVLRAQERGRYRAEITDQNVNETFRAKRLKHDNDPRRNRSQLRTLSPAESLFGTMGYRGRVHPADGVITGPAPGAPLQIAPMEAPVAHRLAKPGAAERGQLRRGMIVVEIREVEGRKFYYDGDIVNARSATSRGEVHAFTHELVDYVPGGARITLDVHLEVVHLAELGALLIGAGHGPGAGILRFGGFKPAGLGKVELLNVRADLHRGAATRTWRRAAPVELDLPEAIRAAHESLIDEVALRELDTVTTLKRP